MSNSNRLPKKLILSLALCCFIRISASCQNTIDTSSGPGVFAEGIVSTPYTEWATSFTPDGKTVYFSQGAVYWTMCFSKNVNGKWMKPQVVNISGQWGDTDPFVSPDGKRLFFISNRPISGTPQDKRQPGYHIWYANRLSDDKWSGPNRLESPVNLDGVSNYAPSVSISGDLFFCSRGREGHEGMASYFAKWLGDHYDQPRLLALNGKEETQDPFVAPDERYLIFVSGNDLFICFRNGNNWSAAQNIGPQVNNGDSNSSPYVSSDGKTLYYSSSRTKGFYKRNSKDHTMSYDELVTEMQSIFNSQPNILTVPIEINQEDERIIIGGYHANALTLKTDTGEVRSELQKINQSYGQAFGKGDSAAFVNCYTPDACIMPANSPEICGTQGQFAFFKFAYQSGVRNIVFSTAGLFGLTAQFVTEQGNYEMFGENKVSLGKGKYIVLWKKTSQGWKMYRDMFSSNK